jgi:hypothetical protein
MKKDLVPHWCLLAVFHAPQTFFDCLLERISMGRKKKRLPNTTTTFIRKVKPSYATEQIMHFQSTERPERFRYMTNVRYKKKCLPRNLALVPEVSKSEATSLK